jgi:hypothetical protein
MNVAQTLLSVLVMLGALETLTEAVGGKRRGRDGEGLQPAHDADSRDPTPAYRTMYWKFTSTSWTTSTGLPFIIMGR